MRLGYLNTSMKRAYKDTLVKDYRNKVLDLADIEAEDATKARPMEAYETLTIDDVNRQIQELEALLARLP